MTGGRAEVLSVNSNTENEQEQRTERMQYTYVYNLRVLKKYLYQSHVNSSQIKSYVFSNLNFILTIL